MASNNPLSALDQAVLFGLEHEVFADDVGQALLQIYHSDVADQRIVGMIEHRVTQEQRRQAFNPMPFRPPRLDVGELVLGADLEGRPLRVPIQSLRRRCSLRRSI